MTMHKTMLAAGLAATAPAAPALADTVLSVDFQERETGDSFRVENVTPCEGVLVKEVSIDFATANGELFFDIAEGGPGYPDEPADDVEILSGAGFVKSISRLEDGGEVLTLTLETFSPGDSLRFAVDVDDAQGPVPGTGDDASAQEVEGTAVAVLMENAQGVERAEVGAFGNRFVAMVPWTLACLTPQERDEVDPLDERPEPGPLQNVEE